MAVYYKFKSAKDYDSIPIDGHFISVAILKEKIFETKHLGRGTDFDLMVSNAQTNEEYADEAMLIPKNTSVLVRRVPGRPRMPIVTEREEPQVVENKQEDAQQANSSYPAPDSSIMRIPEENEWDEFGNDLYAIPEVMPVQSSNHVQDAPPPNKADEDSKIKALIDTSALDWQRQTQDSFGPGRGFGRGMGGRMMNGRGFGRGMGGIGGMGFEKKTPPPGYICHRCKVPGHFIQHCPTNGDPTYDIKRVKPPTGIPKSMLMATPDGSYALPSGAVAVLKPNEAAFEREIEGLPSTARAMTDIPPELRCPLCKEVMQDAVLTSKCCFTSFCDKCIRNHIISKLACVCGASNILADDLLPNKTLRDTINRMMESNNSSADNAGSMLQVQDMESARPIQPKMPSPTLSATSKGEHIQPQTERTVDVKDNTVQANHVTSASQISQEKGRSAKIPDASEATHESMTVKGATSQCSAPVADEEVQQNPSASEPGKKKKRKKVRVPTNVDLPWRGPQDMAAENYMMPYAPAACNPYWNGGTQLGMDGFMNPYGGVMPYMGYVPGPFDVPLGGMVPQDPFGGQGYMMPVPPQRDFSEFAMTSNLPHPGMSREEFEVRKADLRRKREMERRGERDASMGREMSSNGDVSSMKPKHRMIPQPPPGPNDHHHHRPHFRGEREPSPERSHHHRPHFRGEREPSPERSHHHRQHYRDEPSPDRPHRHHHHHGSERPPSIELEPVQLSKRRPADHDDAPPRELEPVPARPSKRRSEPSDAAKASEAAEAERKQKASVFSRISFPDEKKRKHSSTENGYKEPAPSSSSHHHHHRLSSNGHREEIKGAPAAPVAAVAMTRKSNVVQDNDSSDDERHFKRRPTRYKPPPPMEMEWEEDVRHSRTSRERDYEREHR